MSKEIQTISNEVQTNLDTLQNDVGPARIKYKQLVLATAAGFQAAITKASVHAPLSMPSAI